MNPLCSLDDIRKPRSLTDQEWEELLLAARSSWLYYMFRPSRQLWTWLFVPGVFFVSAIFDSHGDILAAARTVITSGWIIAFVAAFAFFRVLCGSIDRFGKRKLARQINSYRFGAISGPQR